MSRYNPCFTSHDIKTFRDDGFGHYRLYYNVPAMAGVRVKFDGKWGTITGSSSHIAVVRRLGRE